MLDPKTGVNAFWLASFYGRGKCVSILANAGSDLMVKHKKSNANALHIAIIKGHFDLVRQLIMSNYPPDEVMNSGQTALTLISRYPKQVEIARLIVKRTADIN